MGDRAHIAESTCYQLYLERLEFSKLGLEEIEFKNLLQSKLDRIEPYVSNFIQTHKVIFDSAKSSVANCVCITPRPSNIDTLASSMSIIPVSLYKQVLISLANIYE